MHSRLICHRDIKPEHVATLEGKNQLPPVPRKDWILIKDVRTLTVVNASNLGCVEVLLKEKGSLTRCAVKVDSNGLRDLFKMRVFLHEILVLGRS